MPQINRRKPYKYKSTRKTPIAKTSRTKLRPKTRAFIAGAVLFRNVLQHFVAGKLKRAQSTISKMLSKVQARAEEGSFNL